MTLKFCEKEKNSQGDFYSFYSAQATKASFRKASGQVDFNNGRKKKVASVLTPLCKAFGPTFIFGAVLKLFMDILTFVSPQLLK